MKMKKKNKKNNRTVRKPLLQILREIPTTRIGHGSKIIK